ncbi:MAG TPA: hypothetical protein DEF51_36900, partial [Myxococcales bacterium]|nr:hypothetical protein [Myxococcales bacterium]
MKRRLKVIGRAGGPTSSANPADAPRWGTGLPRSFTVDAPDGAAPRSVRELKDAIRARAPNLWKTVREHRHMAAD